MLRATTVDPRRRHGVAIRLPQGEVLDGDEWAADRSLFLARCGR